MFVPRALPLLGRGLRNPSPGIPEGLNLHGALQLMKGAHNLAIKKGTVEISIFVIREGPVAEWNRRVSSAISEPSV
jgi:hypothetical protein